MATMSAKKKKKLSKAKSTKKTPEIELNKDDEVLAYYASLAKTELEQMRLIATTEKSDNKTEKSDNKTDRKLNFKDIEEEFNLHVKEYRQSKENLCSRCSVLIYLTFGYLWARNFQVTWNNSPIIHVVRLQAKQKDKKGSHEWLVAYTEKTPLYIDLSASQYNNNQFTFVDETLEGDQPDALANLFDMPETQGEMEYQSDEAKEFKNEKKINSILHSDKLPQDVKNLGISWYAVLKSKAQIRRK